MKFACPDSQKRVLLKCGNIASGSATASLGGLDGSSAPGGAEAVVCVESETTCDCAQTAGTAKPSTRANTSAQPRAKVRHPSASLVIKIKQSIMKMNFNFNIMRTN